MSGRRLRSGGVVSVLQVAIGAIVVADVRIPVPIQGQGGVLADISLAVHGLDVPAGSILIRVPQVRVTPAAAEIADVRVPVTNQSQGG